MRLIFILLIFLIQAPTLLGQNLETAIQQIVDDYGVMGMSLYINVNSNVEELNFGLRDFNRNLPVTSDTHYRIASVSKSFTALGLVKLINDGLINLDDDISTAMGYEVKNPNYPYTTITYRMLLSHTSSLQDGSGYAPFLNATYTQTPIPNIAELLVLNGSYYTPNMWRQETPGTYFTYSNINFGLIGTLIEAISGERFDIFMRDQILAPLDIDGSFNIQDLTDINNLSVLYRYNNGWQAQWDNYQGVMPNPPDLTNYLPGTNGLYFAPQGGLRTNAQGMNIFARALSSDGAFYNLNITPANYQLMKAIVWDYNGSNGDNYGGLFNRWGLGLHHANLSSNDAICLSISESFIGHPGEAYGLVSDNYFIEGNDVSFSLLINGVQQGYQIGSSAFYTIEEDIFGAVCDHINQLLSIDSTDKQEVVLSPNPASSAITINLTSAFSTSEIAILDITGKTLKYSKAIDTGSIELALTGLPSGIYFIRVSAGKQRNIQKLIIE